MTFFAMNEFALRHTKESSYSYFDGTFDELFLLLELGWDKRKKLDKQIFSVPVKPDKFFSGVVRVDESTKLHATFEARREGEMPHIVVRAEGKKLPAVVVEVIVYSHAVLAKKNENSTEADFEIVSINAQPTLGEEPMDPVSMARNFLDQTGGTKRNFSAHEFAAAILYHSQRAMVFSED